MLSSLVTWGNWWSRNVYSLGTNSPEINEGAIVGRGGTRGGFESKLKRNTEQPSGALGALCKGFLLRYFGFEMELKTYFSLARPGQKGESHQNPGKQLSSCKAWGTERSLKTYDALSSQCPQDTGKAAEMGSTGMSGRETRTPNQLAGSDTLIQQHSPVP